ncbi:MAG: helix-turn-helix domain-containing protein [Bacteroidetes bacterium]|nr:helix-turn-helix domain-containing protein [Bacteroidota bacterium]MBU2585927.1 helix-turn-helix domain-containing protein [Bacteroidota bacterium]
MTDLGKEIKEKRLILGVSLKDISERTRIDQKHLERMENNEFDFLPPLYIKSFLKGYLHSLDIDPSEHLIKLDEILKKKKDNALEVLNEPEAVEFTPEKTIDIKSFLKSRTTILVLISLVLLIVVIILIFPEKQKEPEYIQDIPADTIPRYNEKKQVKTSNEKKEGKFIFSKDSLTLVGIATDSVWLQVKGDGKVVDEIFMRKGEQKFWRAKKNFEILIGNAGAISFSLDRENLPFVGMPGAVKRILIDQEGLKIVRTTNESKNE